jgi:RNA recognition motif-containing protein
MGYGFVRFLYKSSADKALKTLQQSVLDGKSLELKRSERTLRLVKLLKIIVGTEFVLLQQ